MRTDLPLGSGTHSVVRGLIRVLQQGSCKLKYSVSPGKGRVHGNQQRPPGGRMQSGWESSTSADPDLDPPEREVGVEIEMEVEVGMGMEVEVGMGMEVEREGEGKGASHSAGTHPTFPRRASTSRAFSHL